MGRRLKRVKVRFKVRTRHLPKRSMTRVQRNYVHLRRRTLTFEDRLADLIFGQKEMERRRGMLPEDDLTEEQWDAFYSDVFHR